VSNTTFTWRFTCDFLLGSRRRAAKKRNCNRECPPRHCDGSYHFAIAVWRAKAAESQCVKYWEIIADRLSKAGRSLGWVSAIDSQGRTIWIVDAHGYRKRFIVRADEMLTAFVELERAVCIHLLTEHC
jgi:alkyl hydroperoxide reductase subunit AhpC